MTEKLPVYDLSIIIPVYNEEKCLPTLLKRLDSALEKLETSHEIVFVNDGSKDNSLKILLEYQKRNSNVTISCLSRNFGNQQAVTAGLKNSLGKAVVIMDADLQDPPELIPNFITEWKKGFKVVVGVRSSRKEGIVRIVFFKFFYKIFSAIIGKELGIISGVFGLMDRVIVDNLLKLTERNRFIPGLRSWVGYEQTYVIYEREDRKLDKPKQTLFRLIKYGLDAIFSFSYMPLRVSWFIGTIISILSFCYGIILVFLRLCNINVVLGFTTPAVAILFIGGIQLISIGIIGEYLGRVYDEVKNRPFYIISENYWSEDRKYHLNLNGTELKS